MPNGATRRASKALSAAMVRAVQEPGKYHDGGGTGLYLRVDPNGSRFWVQRVTIHGKRCELGLGSPPLVPLAEARDKATDNKRLARAGGDPLSEKRATRSTLTFSEAVEQYLEGKMAEFRNEKHCKQWRATLSTYAMPKIGRMQVETIEVRDVLRVLEPIWTTKTETASRLRGRIENVMSWAAVAGYRTGDNPARWKGNLAEILPKPSKVTKGGNHPALALVDVPEWWRSLAQREGMAAQALQFLTLTTARSGEVRGMAWDELDLGTDDGSDARAIATTATWTIPATRMKGEREHRVALTPQAVAILRALPRLDGNPYVFFAPRGGMLSDMSISAVMRRMQESEVKAGRAGFVDPRNKRAAVPHGLRSTFRQWAAEQGYPRDMAEIALAHFIGSEVERAYQRSDMLERRRAMMADWAGFLRGEAAPAKNVVKLGVAG
jgi:integrase